MLSIHREEIFACRRIKKSGPDSSLCTCLTDITDMVIWSSLRLSSGFKPVYVNKLSNCFSIMITSNLFGEKCESGVA